MEMARCEARLGKSGSPEVEGCGGDLDLASGDVQCRDGVGTCLAGGWLFQRPAQLVSPGKKNSARSDWNLGQVDGWHLGRRGINIFTRPIEKRQDHG